MSQSIASCLLVAALLIITPGADMALVTRNALQHGTRAGFTTTLGIVSGVFIWAFTAAAGVAAVITASAGAFIALKLVGATYLVFLGVRTLIGTRASARRKHLKRDDDAT
jgi:threonine/homoserine/homoserine lactone efflux protein